VLEPLFLSEIEFDPKARGVRDDVLGEGQDTVDVELIEDSVIQLDLNERELFAKLVPLALIGLSVNRSLMQECFIDTVETLLLLADNVLLPFRTQLNLVLPLGRETRLREGFRDTGSHPFRIRVDATSTPAP